mgnify:CR=1 FL=1
MKIFLKQSSAEFRVLQPPGEPRVNIVITDIVFRPFYIHLASHLILKTEEILSSGRQALIGFNKTMAESYTIGPGVSTIIVLLWNSPVKTQRYYRSFMEQPVKNSLSAFYGTALLPHYLQNSSTAGLTRNRDTAI